MRIYFIIIAMLVYASNTWGWWNTTTHPIITEYVAKRFFEPDLLDKELILDAKKLKAVKWLQNGSDLEDQGIDLYLFEIPTRSLNHFHNPIKPIADAGLTDMPISLLYGESALRWSQDRTKQSGSIIGGDWTWQRVRDHQYAYLTALTKTSEETSLVNMLKGLGYQMHLIQDMSQPHHVRNDTHMLDGMNKKFYNGFETWVTKNPSKVFANYSVPKVSVNLVAKLAEAPDLAPVARLFDTRKYAATGVIPPSESMDQGLAEYTNANFFSEDTTFADGYSTGSKHYFPYPARSETNLQDFIEGRLKLSPMIDEYGNESTENLMNIKISKQQTSGVKLNCVAKSGPLTKKYYYDFGEGSEFYGSFDMDEECFKEQAKWLLPQAAGYSLAMLDYFFRGSIAVTIPTDTPPTSKYIILHAKNTTPNNEALNNGTIELMVAYRTFAKENPAASSGKLILSEVQRFKYPEKNNKRAIDPAGTPLEFDLSSNPLPPLATDISLILVYRGDIGNENYTTTDGTDSGKAVAYEEILLDGITGDLELSLPTQGVYAFVSGDSITNTFSDIAIAVRNTTAAPSLPGNAELLVIYRQALGNQFLNQIVGSSSEIYYTSVTILTPLGISNTTKTDLPSALSGRIPVNATDLFTYIIHTDGNGLITHGYRDIAEPTPVDVFNNTDYTCINNNWYRFDEPEAVAIRSTSDTSPHAIADISFQAAPAGATALDPGTANNLSTAGTVLAGDMLRLGYILTDYTNSYAFRSTKLGNTYYPFPVTANTSTFAGAGFKNDGITQSQMFVFRGKKMWNNDGVVFVNNEYPANSDCTWDALKQKLGL